MQKKSIIIFILVFLVLISIAAATEYPSFGYNNYNIPDYGVWGQYYGAPDYAVADRLLTGGAVAQPIIADLDNDGTTEIIVETSNQVSIYNYSNQQLNLEDGITGYGQGMQVFDIDGDGKKELLLGNGNEVRIYDYSSEGIVLEHNISNLIATGYTSGFIFHCFSTDRCLAIGASSVSQATGAQGFNSTGKVGSNAADSRGTNLITSPDYAGAWGTLVNSTDQVGIIEIQYLSGNYFDSFVAYRLKTDGSAQSASANQCGGFASPLPQMYMSSPMIMNFDGLTSNGNEVVKGCMASANTFNIKVFKSDLTPFGTFPILQTGQGQHISNLIQITDDNNAPAKSSACVMGYDNQSGGLILDLLCASVQSSTRQYDAYEYIKDVTSEGYVLSWSNSLPLTGYIMATNFNGPTVMNAYGIFKTDISTPSADVTCIPSCYTLRPLFEMPDINASWVASNSTDPTFNSADLIGISKTNVFYVDDRLYNHPANFLPYSDTQCPKSPIKTNETATFSFKINDSENDLVGANFTAYAGTDFEERFNWTSNVSMATTFSFAFHANVTGSGFSFIACIRDVGTSIVSCLTRLFNVDDGGYINSVANCEGGLITPPTTSTLPCVGAECDVCVGADCVPVSAPTDPFTALMNYLRTMLGLSWTVLWLILMAVVGLTVMFGLFVYAKDIGGVLSLLAVAFIEMILLIIGWQLGFISGVVIIVIVVICLIPIGLFVASKFQSTG